MESLEVAIAGEICLSRDPGASMRKWREIFGISQTELADFLKVSSSTISDYEGGRRKSPGIGVISRFVKALIEIDKMHGGKIIRQLEKDFKKEDIFEAREFFAAVKGKTFAQKIDAEVVACPAKLKETVLYGYTLIDSIKVILKMPVHEYMFLYGRTPERALIFTKVETGRSPLIAVKVGKFSTEMKPAMIVLHGIKDVDVIAVKIAESERIPLLVTNKSLEEIKKVLAPFEG